uniref:Lipocalin n=1 Tax=Rhipicephalus zambeziensis TaxID=60191 RepID=A0A224YBF2_9ACAR
MAQKHFWIVLLCSVMAAQAEPNGTNPFRLPNIRKFYMTRQPIWTLQTTERTVYSCKVDVPRSINKLRVYFQRLYYWHIARVNNTMEGVFKRLNAGGKARAPPDAMMVRIPNIIFTDTERLEYESHDGTCGMFLVSSISGDKYYDLRVWNVSVRRPDRKCMERFHYAALQKRQLYKVLYKDSCQQILH